MTCTPLLFPKLKLSVFLLFPIAFFLATTVASAATVTWTGGTTGTWETGTNWSSGSAPTSSDDVTINRGTAGAAVTLSSGQTANFNTLTIGGGATTNSLTLVGNIGTGGSITIKNLSTITQQNAVQQVISGTLTLESGGTLTHTANTTTVAGQQYYLNWSAATINAQSGSTITAAGKGYAGGSSTTAGQGPGAGAFAGGGGAHAGNGGNNTLTSAAGGTAYCDITDVDTMGSGGAGGNFSGNNYSGGAGGGLIIFNVSGTATFNGAFTAAGAAGSNNARSGAGAGGGIRVTADTIAGTPTSLTAAGGTISGSAGGSGGGGCIQFTYTTSNSVSASTFLSTSAMTVTGSTGGYVIGGSGSFYTKDTDSTYGDLTLKNGSTASTAKNIIVSNLTFDNLYASAVRMKLPGTTINTSVTLNNDSALDIDSGAGNEVTFGSGVTSVSVTGTAPTITNAGTFTANSVTSLSATVSNSGTFNANGLTSSSATFTTTGVLNLTSLSNMSGTTLTVSSGGTWNNATTITTNGSSSITLSSGATVSSTITSLSSAGTFALYQGTANITDLTISGGTFTMSGFTTSNGLTLDDLVMTGGTLNHTANTTTAAGQVHIINISANTANIGASATISADTKGYAGVATNTDGNGPGAGNNDSGGYGSGGGHGGVGGPNAAGTNLGGNQYCSATNVATMGSSGASTTTKASGAGGGLIILDISGTATLSGTITADGGTGTSTSAGGAGGGIRITADTISGTPTSLTATGGGAGSGATAGGGSGGCIQFSYTTSSSVSASSFLASSAMLINGGIGGNGGGGGIGASGTFFIEDLDSGANGDLVTKNTTTPVLSNTSFSNLTFANFYGSYARIKLPGSTIEDSITLNNGSVLTVDSSTTATIGPDISSVSVTGTGPTITVAGTFAATGVTSLSGFTLSVSSGGIWGNAGTITTDTSSSITLASGSTVSNTLSSLSSAGTLALDQGASLSITDLTISAGTVTLSNYTTSLPLTIAGTLSMTGGSITNTANSTAQTHIVNISAATLTLGASATITVDGKGYASSSTSASTGNGPSGGVGTPGYPGGGAHGGAGGAGNSGAAGGTAYCDISDVDTMGSSGGTYNSTNRGGAGGGLIILTVSGTATLSGTITADGNSAGSTVAGGGAGGGVKITANTISGTPASFTATGGAKGSGGNGGGGGGGCIQLLYSVSTSISSATLTGGTGFVNGGVGLFSASQVNSAPAATTPNTISQSTNGSGYVTFSTTVSDVDTDDTKLKVEYSDDGGSTWNDPDLVSVTPSAGTVDIDDSNTYQIGTANAIDTSGGAKTLTIVWDTKSASNGGGSLDDTSQSDIKVRVTPNDSGSDGSTATSSAFSVDNLDPTISSRTTKDLDGDGYIDAIYVVFSENIADSSVSAGDFTIAGASGLAFSSTTNSDTANDNDIYVTFTDGVLSTNAAPNFTYTAGSLTDSKGNSLATVGPTASTDGAGPAILSATASDETTTQVGIDYDDTVTIIFSENTNQPTIDATNINSVLALSSSHTWRDGGNAISSAVWNDAATLVITLSAGTSVPTVAISDTITLNGTTITDGTNNSSTTAFSSITGSFGSNSAPTANAPNTISQATDGTGYITFQTTISDDDSDDTKLKVEYSDDSGVTWYDPVLVSATPSAGTVDLDNSNTYQIGTANAIDTSGGSKTLTIVWNTKSASNGGGSLDDTSQSDIKVRVTPNDATEDGTVQSSSDFSVDNIDPTITGRVTADLDGDGYIDAIHITFAENILDTSVSAGNFTIAGTTGAAFSSTTSSDTANDNDIYITFTDGVLTTNSTANITYTAGSLTDAKGNSLATVGPTASTDGAGPAILSATASEESNILPGIDNDDTVTITFSENTNQPVISAININTVLTLNNSHTWRDGGNAIGSAVWSDAATLVITLSTGTSVPTVAVDDTITLDGTTITDGTNGSSTVAFSAITGGFSSNTPPTVSISSATEKTDGTGAVDIAVVVDDADDSTTLRLEVAYKAGATCDSGNSAATIDETDGNTTASTGDPKVTTSSQYQVGNSSGWITSASGANTVNFDWLSDSDVSSADGTYCISITPYDGIETGTPDTITLTLDNANPTSAGNLTLNTAATTSLTLDLGAAGVDTNLSNYKIYYKAATSGVTESDTLHDTILSGDYDANDTTTVSDLSINSPYTFNIWTYDTYGNESSGTELTKYTLANAPSAPTVSAVSTSSLNAIIGQNSNPSNTTYAISVGEYYVQANGSLGVSAVWQTYAEWGGVTGQNITGLSANTQYAVSVKARNGDNTETAFSASTSKYTYASPVTSVSLVNATTADSYGLTLTWTSAGQSGVKIDFATVTSGACDTTYDVGNYDNASSNASSPRSISAAASTCYKARILSYNGDGILNTSDAAVSEGVTTPPAAPSSLAKDSADESSINWVWDPVAGATNYKIYRSSDDTEIGETGDDSTSYIQTTSDGSTALTADTQYTVYIRAIDANGEGIGSSTVSAYTTANALDSLGSDAGTQSTDTLKWTWSSGGAEKDFYAYMTSPAVNSGYITDLFWIVDVLSPNTEYTAYVRARNEEDVETGDISASTYTSQNAPEGIIYSEVTSSSMTVTADGTFPNLTLDASGIRFQNTTTAADNTFQDNDWTNSSLSPNTEYTYVVSAINGDGDETSSVTSSKYTLAAVPGGTTVNGATISTLNVDLDANSNSLATQYAIHETGTGLYVQADNTLGAGAYWQTDPGTITITGLSKNTSYEFETKARNADNIETAYGTASSAYTLVSAASDPTVASPTTTSLGITVNTGTNPSNTTYKIHETTTDQYVQADGTLGESAIFRTAAAWGTTTVTGLSVNTQYNFTTTARNASNVEAAASAAGFLYTLANAPGVTTVDSPSTTTLDVTINANSNPSATEFSIYESTSELYVQADGSLGETETWQTMADWGTVSGTPGQIQVSGLSKNESYTFVVTARNGDEVSTAAAEGVSLYTSAAVPLSLSAAIDLTLGTTVTWLTNGNPEDTSYYAENVDTPETNSGWTSEASWLSEDDKTQGVRYCYQVKARNEDEVETEWLTISGDDCAYSAPEEDTEEEEEEEESSSPGGGGGVSSFVSRIKKQVEAAKEKPVVIPSNTKIIEDDFKISKKEAENTSEPIQVTNKEEKVSLFISEKTNITIEGQETFEGHINPPSVIVNPTFIPEELSSNLLVAIKIDTSSNKSVYFSQPAVVTIGIEDILAQNPDYNPADLVVYFYNHSTGQYEYVSRLTIAPNGKTASFLTYHLSTFVVLDVDAAEEAMLDSSNPFSDMSGHWAKYYVNRLYDMGAINGRTYTKFMPNEKVTRAELLKMALLGFKYQIKNLDSSGFSDVPDDSWVFSFVSTAAEAGLIGGYPDGTFKPNNYVNRAEALKILLAAGKINTSQIQLGSTAFTDVARDAWYKTLIDYATSKGIVSGYADGTFKPGADITRAEAAKLTVKIMDLTK